MSSLEPPRITIYTRILSNIDGRELEKYTDIKTTTPRQLNFGAINCITGGESPVIIEFDIWNNEPAFAAGLRPDRVSDAENCTFTAWDDDTCSSSTNIKKDISVDTSYIYARNISKGYNVPFKPIAGANGIHSSDILGNVDVSRPGVLSGQPGGDHTKIQTKIVIPPNTRPNLTNFVFCFEYNFV